MKSFISVILFLGVKGCRVKQLQFLVYFIAILFIEGKIELVSFQCFNSFFLAAITGTEKLHHLLSQGKFELRMDMDDFDNQTRYVKYSRFNVGNESTKYTATISGYSGNVSECFLSCIKNSRFRFFMLIVFNYCRCVHFLNSDNVYKVT